MAMPETMRGPMAYAMRSWLALVHVVPVVSWLVVVVVMCLLLLCGGRWALPMVLYKYIHRV